MPKTLVEQVEAFFYEDPKFQESMESFARKHCDVIDLSTEENKLEYTPLYEKYTQKFESLITEYIESLGATVKDFYKELKEVCIVTTTLEMGWAREVAAALEWPACSCDFVLVDQCGCHRVRRHGRQYACECTTSPKQVHLQALTHALSAPL